MKITYLASLALASALFVACDDTTDNIGSGTLIDTSDNLEVVADTFEVTTRSIIADSVLARNNSGYLGKVRDPETGAYLTSNFMTQFYVPENFELPKKENIKSLVDGNVVADSCDIQLYYNSFYGDSLAPMKLTAYELNVPIPEKPYYSNFDPEKDGYVDENRAVNKVYTLTDLNVDEATRNGSSYVRSIRIPLGASFGTDLMRRFYDNPADFKNAYTFIHKVLPGFYFKNKSGLGAMANIYLSQLNVYFRHQTTTTTTDGTTKDTVIVSVAAFPGTEEVLQTTSIVNDKEAIKRLAADNTCTYIKSPAGIFTEMTLPVEAIMKGHEGDTLNTAKVSLTRILSNTSDNEYAIEQPKTLLILPKAQMYKFFENKEVADYKTSFLASFDSSTNKYTFSNISSLVRHLWENRDEEDWDKVVLIPVSTTYNTSGELTNVTHDMSIASTRLVGGSENGNGPINISVIYSKFK